MKLKVEMIFTGGLIAEDDNTDDPNTTYYLVDAETGKPVCDMDFYDYEKLEAYIADHFPDCERWIPPPAPGNEAALLSKFFTMYENGLLDNPSMKRIVRNFMVNQLYQSGYPDETSAKIKKVIADLKE